MSTLVLGGTGFIGSQVVRRLAARGHGVVAAHRGHTSCSLPGSVAVQHADRADPDRIGTLVQDIGARVVVDMLALTEGDTIPLLATLAGRIERYVLVSSVDVYRNYGGLTRHEDAAPDKGPLAENSPLRRSRFPYRGETARAPSDPDRIFDDYDKIPIEQAVRAQTGFDWTILRLPMTFGPGDRQRRFGWIIWRLQDGREILPIDRRMAGWHSTHGFVDDVADGIALAATHQRAARQIFNLGMTATPTQAEWVIRIARAMKRRARVVEVDPAPGAILTNLAEQVDPRFPLIVDTGRVRAELGLTEITSPEEALRRTIGDELARGRPAGFDDDYRAEDHLLAAANDRA